MLGQVKWFSEKKGWGFVTGDNNLDYFLHFSAILMSGYKTLEDGQRVEFDADKTDRGLSAINVVPVETE